MWTLIKDTFHKKQAFTLVEVVVSISLLAVIVSIFIPIVLQSTLFNNVTSTKTNATYTVQNEMETIQHQLSNLTYNHRESFLDATFHQNAATYTKDKIIDSYTVVEKITTNENQAKVIIRAYATPEKKQVNAQMETVVLWGNK